MDERKWLSCSKAEPMLSFLRQQGKLSDRKARLFAVACCRQIWHLMVDGRSRTAVVVAERFADGLTIEKWLNAARDEAFRVFDSAESEAEVAAVWASDWVADAPADLAAEKVAAWVAKAQRNTKGANRENARLLREIIGPLPFRPMTLAPSVRTWNGGLLQRLAEAAYHHRTMPAGTLAPDRLAVLSDALEEAGADAALVAHLREPGPHYRGCFALDLILNHS